MPEVRKSLAPGVFAIWAKTELAACSLLGPDVNNEFGICLKAELGHRSNSILIVSEIHRDMCGGDVEPQDGFRDGSACGKSPAGGRPDGLKKRR
jgi:hypothetical protein